MSRLARKPVFNTLCLDPSVAGYGYAIVSNYLINNKPKLIDCGLVKTSPQDKKNRIRKGDDRIRRLNEIGIVLRDLLEQYKINYVVSELPHGSQNAVAAMLIGMSVGLTQGLQNFADIQIEWYAEGDAKKALLGKASATKQEIITAIDKLYDVPWPSAKYKQEGIADALAIHNVALRNSHVLKTMRRQ